MAQIAVDGQSFVYALNGDFVEKYNRAGGFVKSWNARDSIATEFPLDRLAVAESGTVYVSVPGASRILRFTSTGQPLESWSVPGPTAMALDGRGNLFVADDNGVEKRAADGTKLTTWSIRRPQFMAVGPTGTVYASLASDPRVLKLNASGRRIGTIGSLGEGRGQFFTQRPLPLAVDRDGNIWASEGFRAQKFAPDGRFLLACGGSTPNGPTILRAGVLAAALTGDLYVSEITRIRRLGRAAAPAIPCDVPRLSAVSLDPASFHLAPRPTSRVGGTRLRFTLSQPSTVKVEVYRRLGRRTLREGSVSRQLQDGRKSVRLSGWLADKALRPGTHTFAITAIDPSGNRSKRRVLRGRVLE